jgi:hypothetical protein
MTADEANGVFIKVRGPLFHHTPKHGDKFIMVSKDHDSTTLLVFANQDDIDQIIDELLEAKTQLHKIKP